MNQYHRDLLIASFLDITVDQFHSTIGSEEGPQVIKDLTEAGVSDYIANYLQEIAKGPDAADGQLMMQALALMGDEGLHLVVKTFGTDPLT